MMRNPVHHKEWLLALLHDVGVASDIDAIAAQMYAVRRMWQQQPLGITPLCLAVLEAVLTGGGALSSCVDCGSAVTILYDSVVASAAWIAAADYVCSENTRASGQTSTIVVDTRVNGKGDGADGASWLLTPHRTELDHTAQRWVCLTVWIGDGAPIPPSALFTPCHGQ